MTSTTELLPGEAQPLPDEGHVTALVADVVAERAQHLFGLMGNGNVHLISRLTRRGFPFTSARHESATVAMADAYYRATGNIAAATTTYGAGFTNAYSTLAEARMARIPLVLVVGDAPSTGQRSFDIDQTKAAKAAGVVTLVARPGNAAAITHRAFDLAFQTVQPVVLALPYDLATAPPTAPEALEPLPGKPLWPAQPADLDRVASLLAGAKRPLILGGRGMLMAGAASAVREAGDRIGALFMTTVMASNAFNSPWDLGIAGGFTRSHRLDIARQADVVLVIGASQNTFQTRYGTLFPAQTTVVRIDNEPDTGSPAVAEYIRADIPSFTDGLLERLPHVRPTWRDHAPDVSGPDFRSSHPRENPDEFGPDGRLNPRAVVAALDGILPAERSVVMDGGHFIGWAPMYLSVPDPHAMILVGTAFQSIGMGFGSASGVSVARPERTTVLVSGDGGGLMGLADFETFLRVTRKGVVVVLNDSAYGAELHQYAAKGLHDQAMLIDEVDFAAVGRALGANGTKAHTLADLEHLQGWLASNQNGVYVLDVAISRKVVAEFMAESVAAKGCARE
ncbi:thiamine pyrophosphate-binding protein [Arthrobacter liuii]|uniref:Acetolactate synthase I/II/III large subunit n=1 Tax=Arthrobacter liuii TaxID=1476996 RepID=A0ABQ2B286_9MICC|nr:thiamine pyrophosphate-binding protein [Arthrobacter liuii]GGI02379.1 acetolactate synthase I/II/III large subunit [Arthrobacter liuii]